MVDTEGQAPKYSSRHQSEDRWWFVQCPPHGGIEKGGGGENQLSYKPVLQHDEYSK